MLPPLVHCCRDGRLPGESGAIEAQTRKRAARDDVLRLAVQHGALAEHVAWGGG